MLRRKIDAKAAMLIVVMVSMAALGFSYRLAEKKSETPIHKITADECLRCHSGDKSIRAMQDKAGNAKFLKAYWSKPNSGPCPVSTKHG